MFDAIYSLYSFRVGRIAADAPDSIGGIKDDSAATYDIDGTRNVGKGFFGKHGVQCEE